MKLITLNPSIKLSNKSPTTILTYLPRYLNRPRHTGPRNVVVVVGYIHYKLVIHRLIYYMRLGYGARSTEHGGTICE